MENNIFITNREIVYSEPYSLEKKINERMNEQCHKYLEERLKRILDNRPRYSKRIPTKLYMKFHTLDIIRWEVKSYKKPLEWYTLEQENKVIFKFRFLNLFN
jgi:hypothetical protein